MNCPKCGSEDVERIRRHGAMDAVRATLGSWPYRCSDCDSRFHSRYRYPVESEEYYTAQSGADFFHSPHQESGATFRAEAAAAEADFGPAMAFRTHEQKPQAKIVVEADNHEQLNNILLALNRAVHSYQHSSKEQTETAGSRR
jgi:hypothetical protein